VATKLNATLQVIGTPDCDALIVEPWADEIALSDGVTYDVVAVAEDMPWFQVEPRGALWLSMSMGSMLRFGCNTTVGQ
jgi:hypothetical protein